MLAGTAPRNGRFLCRVEQTDRLRVDGEKRLEEVKDKLTPASIGAGPVLQRDYWAVLDDCPHSCRDVAQIIRERFRDFPPAELVTFHRLEDSEAPLEVGDEMEVRIRMEGSTRVCVVHRNENSITLVTEKGHPEAGRITFGAYPNDDGDVIFHIRSQARASSRKNYAAFLTAGEAMQTNTWTDFIDRLAHSLGGGVKGVIHAETTTLDDSEVADEIATPTFIADGDR